MQMHWVDIGIFLAFFAVVIVTSMYKSRKEETGEDFFLAGRNLLWPLTRETIPKEIAILFRNATLLFTLSSGKILRK